MIDQRLLSARQNYHVKIRRQDFEDKLIKKRFQFIGQRESHTLYLKQQYQFQTIDTLDTLNSIDSIQNFDSKFIHQLSMNLQFVDFRSIEHKNSLDIAVKFIIEARPLNNTEEQLVLFQITNHIKLILIKITNYEDEQVLPYLSTIYEFLKVHFQLKIIYNIACIIQWNNYLNNRQIFMDLFINDINKKQSFYSNEDISIINGFSQLKLKQQYCFNFIGIINRYLAFNINNTLEEKGLINSFDALTRICKINSFQAIFIQISKSQYIMQQCSKQLRDFKYNSLITKICFFLSGLVRCPKALQQVINRQCTIFIHLLQIVVKHKTTEIIKQNILFFISQVVLIPEIVKANFHVIIQKLSYIHINYASNAKIMLQVQMVYLNMICECQSFSDILKTIKNYKNFLLLCMQNQTRQIKSRTLQAILTMIELDLVDQDEGYGIISDYLLNKYGLMQYLQLIIHNQNHDLSEKATYIKQLIDPCIMQ